MPADSSRDPGLQPERTTLSWTRTAAGLLLNAMLNLRSGYVHDAVPLLVLSGALVVAAAAVFGFGRVRRHQLARRGPAALADPLAMRVVTAATLLATGTGLASVLVGHRG